jgi:putative nucleotidyltransferase with HDIG domain
VKKKLDVDQLRVGMYVTELDRPWRETPFLFQGFEIRTQGDIEELRQYCRQVVVDLPETYGASPPKHSPPADKTAAPAAVEPARQHEFEQEILKKVDTQPDIPPAYHDQATLEEEVENIRRAHAEARQMVRTVLEDVRHGKSIDTLGPKKMVAEMVESVIRNPDALTCFAQLKKKDEYTALHSLRVCILALAFGRHLGFDGVELNILGIGALLHDIGKMKVPNDILNKPGSLDDDEYTLMKSHVPRGVEILEQTRGITPAAIQVARCHHERFSGGGYISGLQGEQIGLFGLIGAIVDCYDAITSDRAYHAGMSAHAALKKMYEWRGRDFHGGLVEQFIQCMGIYPIGSVVALNTGEIGVVVTLNRVRRLKPRVALVLTPEARPYTGRQTVDLATHSTRDGKPCEIERVLEPGSYGINPTEFLPVPAVA